MKIFQKIIHFQKPVLAGKPSFFIYFFYSFQLYRVGKGEKEKLRERNVGKLWARNVQFSI